MVDLPTAPKRPAGEPPRQIDRYRITKVLGRGGMGVVYRAHDPEAERDVAIKLILARKGAEVELRKRFEREARALAKLRHKNIMPIHDLGEHDGAPYIVMPLIEGASLDRHLIRTGRYSGPDAARLIRTVGEALSFAHDQGIIHRDIKPSNILINTDGEPILTDFGLARDERNQDNTVKLTLHGRVLGTPGYLPPEQARGDVDQMGPHSDQYSLGATLYELLSGRPPQLGLTFMQVVAEAARHPLALRALVPEVDPALESICLLTLQVDPRHRYPSLTELLEDLDRYLDGDRPLATRRKIRRRTQEDPATQSDEGARARRRGLLNKALVVLVAVQLVALVGVVAWIVSRPTPEPTKATNEGPTKRARASAVLAELDGLHDIEGRLAVCDRALELDPEFANAYVERARAKSALTKRSATPQTASPERLVRPALDDLKTALAHDPDSAWAHYVRAEIALEHQHDATLRVVGVSDLRRVLDLDPKGPVGFLARGRLMALKRNFEQAIAHYTQALQFDIKLRDAYVARADAHLAQRDFQAALADAAQAVELDPLHSRSLVLQAAGRFHLRNDRIGALKDLGAALKLHPTFARAIALRSYVRLERLPNGVLKNETISERDAVKASERDALQALRLDPRTALAHLVLAEIYRPNRNLAKALHHANKAVELSFRSEAAHLTRGRLRSLDGDDDHALVDYEEVLDINPNNARALSNKAGILVVRSDHEQARHLIDQALEIDHKLPFAHFLRGYINMRARPRNFRKAIDDLSASIGLDPEYADAYYQRALCFHDLQRFGDCLRDLAKAEALSKKSASRVSFPSFEVTLFRGHCHYRRQERALALKAYQRYVRRAPVGHKSLKKIKQRIREILSKPR